MQNLFAAAAAHKVATTAVTVALVVGGGVVAAAVGKGPETATVERVIDGDTVDVSYRGEVERVRLLNVDTPETKDPDQPIECMGPEATTYLEDLLPGGTPVILEFDQERTDQYGRLLAGVMLDGALVNAEIARAGYGIAVLYEPNDRFYDDVVEAQGEAQRAAVGLYDETVPCTVPAQVESFASAAEDAAAPPAAGAGLGALEDHVGELVAAAAIGTALSEVLDKPTGVPALAVTGPLGEQLTKQLTQARAGLTTAQASAQQARDAEVERLEAQRRAAEEAARRAAEEAARQEAARVAAAEAARQAAENAAREAAEAAAAQKARDAARRASSSQSSSSGSSSGGSGSSDGYTGCRKYAPGGKTYTPIPCP